MLYRINRKTIFIVQRINITAFCKIISNSLISFCKICPVARRFTPDLLLLLAGRNINCFSRHILIASDDEKRAFPVQFAVRLVCSSCNNSFAFDLLIISHSRDFVKSFFCQPRKGGFPTKGVILLRCCFFIYAVPAQTVHCL